MWCDDNALWRVKRSTYGVKMIYRSLNCFSEAGRGVYEEALRRLGPDFKLDTYANVCRKDGCVFSRRYPGAPARTRYGHSNCVWCDPTALLEAQDDPYGRQHLNQSLNSFLQKSVVVYAHALRRLEPDFVQQARWCMGKECVYSYRKPGERARSPPGCHQCLWCTEGGVRGCEGSRLSWLLLLPSTLPLLLLLLVLSSLLLLLLPVLLLLLLLVLLLLLLPLLLRLLLL